jgi:hypothetical protein
MKRAASLVVAFLLASVGTAFAECAWVLWQERTSFGADGLTTWTIESVWKEREHCERLARDSVQREVRSMSDAPDTTVRTERDGTLVFISTPRAQWIQHFRCLPDTIDPRGPKGGSR